MDKNNLVTLLQQLDWTDISGDPVRNIESVEKMIAMNYNRLINFHRPTEVIYHLQLDAIRQPQYLTTMIRGTEFGRNTEPTIYVPVKLGRPRKGRGGRDE